MKNNAKVKSNKMPFLLRGGVPFIISSILCIILGLLVGYIVLLCINPSGAGSAIASILKNFLYYKDPQKALYYFGSTIVKTIPLLFCALSILFAQKTGLFNIGVSGQYTVGAGAAIMCALSFHMPWYLCIFFATLSGALFAMISGALKAYKNVNEVISGIMLNWIALYFINYILTPLKEPSANFTMPLNDNAPSSVLPSAGLPGLFADNSYVTIAIFIAPVVVFIIWLILNKTVFGYEIKATGHNKNAALYSGMKKEKNIILSMAISGALAGMGAALFYLTDINQWVVSSSTVPSMGFDGIAAAFLGGLNPIGTIFSSYFIKHITLGGTYLDKNIFSTQSADMISAFIIYFCAFAQFVRTIAINAYQKKQSQKQSSAAIKEE